MRPGKAFELLIKRILLHIGFSEVASDGLYVFDGAPGQMIQGLAEAHNADVLLEPPVQTPFYSPTRILIECKDYRRKIGLNTIRGVLGLREDINHFDIVDQDELADRRNPSRTAITHVYTRYYYQVALASMNGFTIPCQNFAATYRIPLIEFNMLPFWERFNELLCMSGFCPTANYSTPRDVPEDMVLAIADEVGSRMAVAITNSGQMLFLYRTTGETNEFGDYYSLHWHSSTEPWTLRSGRNEYLFQLPESILKVWLNNSSTNLDTKREAINCKANFLSNMVVYYSEYGRPMIKMISIDKYQLDSARHALQRNGL